MNGTENYKIRTIVVEDEERIRELICNKITSLDDSFEIVETAGNGQEAIEKIEKLRPQVVFTDISMPVMDGMELIQRIKQLNPNITIVIISGFSDFSYAQQAIRYGVFNYLLKPLEDGALLETLFDLKKIYSYLFTKTQRHIMYSDNYQLISAKKAEFIMIEVCVGNVIYSIQDEEVHNIYSKEIGMINWNQLLEKLCGSREWFLSDDHVVNQKIIGIKVDDREADEPIDFANTLMEELKQSTGMEVSVCYSEHRIEQGELWNYAKQLRNMIQKRVVIGESIICHLEEGDHNKNDVIEIIKMQLNTHIKNYFISKDFDTLMKEIKNIFQYMKSNHASQENVEKIGVYVLKLLEFSDLGYGRDEIDELQHHMMKIISLSDTEEKLFENLIQILGMANREDTSVEEDKDGEAENLLAYVDENYLLINNMEKVASAFGYSYAYVSRLFKQKKGMSMSRYITRKKIDQAKELFHTKPELKVAEVGRLCGYHDYRYFGRVFKGEVGFNPGEYKEKIDKKL